MARNRSNSPSKSSRKALKNSYLRFLRGWLFDSNSTEGAVLKGWVESRLGLPPLFHQEPIADIHSEAYFLYTVEKMKGARILSLHMTLSNPNPSETSESKETPKN